MSRLSLSAAPFVPGGGVNATPPSAPAHPATPPSAASPTAPPTPPQQPEKPTQQYHVWQWSPSAPKPVQTSTTSSFLMPLPLHQIASAGNGTFAVMKCEYDLPNLHFGGLVACCSVPVTDAVWNEFVQMVSADSLVVGVGYRRHLDEELLLVWFTSSSPNLAPQIRSNMAPKKLSQVLKLSPMLMAKWNVIVVLGGPLNGKTTVAQAISKKHKMPYYDVNTLQSLSAINKEVVISDSGVVSLVIDASCIVSREELVYLRRELISLGGDISGIINLSTFDDTALCLRCQTEEQEANLVTRLEQFRLHNQRALAAFSPSNLIHCIDATPMVTTVLAQSDRAVNEILNVKEGPKHISHNPFFECSPALLMIEDFDHHAAVMRKVVQLIDTVTLQAFAQRHETTPQVSLESRTGLSVGEYWCMVRPTGTRCLVCGTEDGRLYVVTASPTWRTATIPANSWTGRTITDGAPFVLEATLNPLLMSSTGHKIVVSDVLAWSGNSMIQGNKNLTTRMRVLDQMLEVDEAYTAAPPSPIAIVRGTYYPTTDVPKLVNAAPVDYPVLGLEFASLKSTGGLVQLLTWIPPESQTVDLYALSVSHPDSPDILRVQLGVRADPVSNTVIPYHNEYVEVDEFVHETMPIVEHTVLRCMAMRGKDGTHWWEALTTVAPGNVGATVEMADAIVRRPILNRDELVEVCEASECRQCGVVGLRGQKDPTNEKFYCYPCWETYGYGTCSLCNKHFTLGSLDKASGKFKCVPCNKESRRPVPRGGRPESDHSPFFTYASTIKVNMIKKVVAMTRGQSVVDLCCGRGGDIRKWIQDGGVLRYVGADVNSKCSEDARSRASRYQNGEAKVEVVCEDSLAPPMFTEVLPKLTGKVPIIACQFGLNHAFRTEEEAAELLQNIAMSLVDGGVFFGCLIEAHEVVQRGKKYKNSSFTLEWKGEAKMVVGSQFRLTINNHIDSTEYVVPWELLVTLANNAGLKVVPDLSMGFLDHLNPNSTSPPLPPGEQELAVLYRTYGFQKAN